MVEQRKKIRHYHEPGDLHELTFSCFRRMPLLTNDVWRELLFRSIDRSIERWQFRLVAFVLIQSSSDLKRLNSRCPPCLRGVTHPALWRFSGNLGLSIRLAKNVHHGHGDHGDQTRTQSAVSLAIAARHIHLEREGVLTTDPHRFTRINAKANEANGPWHCCGGRLRAIPSPLGTSLFPCVARTRSFAGLSHRHTAPDRWIAVCH